jgi:hypothetical protein
VTSHSEDVHGWRGDITCLLHWLVNVSCGKRRIFCLVLGRRSSDCRTVTVLTWLTGQSVGDVKANSHIACHAYAVPLSCHAAEGLECVFPIWFTQCGRVWYTRAMLWPCRSSQGHGTVRPSRDGLWTIFPWRLLRATMHSSMKIVIRSVPVLLTMVHTYKTTNYKKDDMLNCWTSSSDISGYHTDFHEGCGTVGVRQGNGMGTACCVWIGLKSEVVGLSVCDDSHCLLMFSCDWPSCVGYYYVVPLYCTVPAFVWISIFYLWQVAVWHNIIIIIGFACRSPFTFVSVIRTALVYAL